MRTKAIPIPRQSLSSAVAERLREKIVRREYAEGEQLRQDKLAMDFQVSRIPVREALRQLEAEGLIKIVAHRGAVVSTLSPAEIEELFEIRALLECEALRLSIPLLTAADMDKAELVLAAFNNSLRHDDDARAWARLNTEFHAALYRRASRPHLLSLIQMINNNAVRYTRLQAYLPHGFDRTRDEHKMLLDLCRNKDTATACQLLREHICNAGHSLAEYLAAQREPVHSRSAD
jgi:DNA-binding GntR family transcriptional regulator